jgi:hypothetical protein
MILLVPSPNDEPLAFSRKSAPLVCGRSRTFAFDYGNYDIFDTSFFNRIVGERYVS